MVNPINSNGNIARAARYQNSLFVAGNFTLMNGQARSNLAEIDLTTGDMTSFSPNVSGAVSDMFVFQDKLLIKGQFSSVDGISLPYGVVVFNLTTRQFSDPLISVTISKYGSVSNGSTITWVKYLPNSNSLVFSGLMSASQQATTRYGLFSINANSMVMSGIGSENQPFDYVQAMDVDQINDRLYYVRWNYNGIAGRQKVGSYNVSNIDSPSNYTWGMSINPSNSWIDSLNFCDSKIFAFGLRISAGTQNASGIATSNAVNGAAVSFDWNIYNNTFPGVAKLNRVFSFGNFIYVAGLFSHVTTAQAVRNSFYVRNKNTGDFVNETINFSFNRVVQAGSPSYVQLYIVNEVRDAIIVEDKLYLFGGNFLVDGVLENNAYGSPCMLALNADGTKIQKRIALLL